jgi:putative DNA methylase
LEANRMGCDITGFDINPMSYWIVKQEIEYLKVSIYTKAAYSLRSSLEEQIGHLYRTTCVLCGAAAAHVKYFLWVKVTNCRKCRNSIDLFPGYLLAGDSRHPKNVFVCSNCGLLTESDDRKTPGLCRHCRAVLRSNGPAGRNRCICTHCGASNSFPDRTLGPPNHRLFAIEYYCPTCRGNHFGRYFKTPDSEDLARVQQAEAQWMGIRPSYVPDDAIPTGDETNRLHRWGYKHYREMFNSRQLLGLELSANLIAQILNERVRNALATNLSDLLRYQNMLCRYDTMALKSLDIFSVHGFPVGLIQCESNLLGIFNSSKNTCIGSGGWANIIEKFRKAKMYCDRPFEVRHRGRVKEIVPIKGEWIGDHLNGKHTGNERIVDIRCNDAAITDIAPASLDAVLTDPPYFGNVQYAELMDFCYVWLRRLAGQATVAFQKGTTRNPQELTGNEDMGRGIDHFTEGLSAVFLRMRKALKPGAPLVFTYHHNDVRAYLPVAVAILDAGLTCSATLPSPAEMGASIHINRTGSSIVDTVFVCRSTGMMRRKWLADSPEGVARIVMDDLESLRAGNVKPSQGDTRCIAFGHLIRLAIWSLRKTWNTKAKVGQRVATVSQWLQDFGGWPEVEKHIQDFNIPSPYERPLECRESAQEYGDEYADISF